ncbi:MAG: thiamine ABC transporter substrate-binding protein [Fusobacteriota bacterium]
MKKVLVLSLMVVLMLNVFGKEKLTVYTYDSFGWVEDKMISKFEEENDCEVKVVKFGNTGKILARLNLEKNRSRGDVVIGFTPTLAAKAKSKDLLEKVDSDIYDKIDSKEIIFDKDGYVVPYDYGGLAIIYNPENLENKPESFKDITNLKNKLIIQDPRTSTTGQDFLLWTIAIYGDNWQEFWENLKPAILTVTPGWSESFSKFEVGEAPMMVSYATDGAYSYHNYESTKYKALIPDEGGYIQREGVGIVKGTENSKLANTFIKFMLSDDFQGEIPLNQWMFPVQNIKMPKAFDYAVTPEKIVELDPKKVEDNLDKWLNKWEEIMTNNK